MLNSNSMKIKNIIIAISLPLALTGCDDWLNVKSNSILTEDEISKYPELVESQFFTNYADLRTTIQCIGDGAMTYRQHHLSAYTDEGASNIPWGNGDMRKNSPGNVFRGIYSQSSGENFRDAWNYKHINTINKFILKYKESQNEALLTMVGEAYFIRAYYYFEMVKRYGGVPLYSGVLDNLSSINNRSTEDESWEYVKSCLDSAIVLLPDNQRVLSEDKDRANKFTALALKSRAMLYAGTLAQKNKVFNNGLQGVPANKASYYLRESAEASKEIVESGKYTLTSNFENLFNGTDEDNNEIIFRYRNMDKTGVYVYIDYWNQSFRIKEQGYTAFMNPTLDVVEQFETLDGEIKPIVNPGEKKANLEDFFVNRDKRLAATVIYPGATYLGEKFSIYRKTIVRHANGSVDSYQYNSDADWSGGAKVPGYEYLRSGLDGIMNNASGNGTTNWGFFLRKTLFGAKKLENYLNHENSQDAVVIRYGEVVLNYAEAATELAKEFGIDEYKNSAQQVFDELRSKHGGLPAKTISREVVRHERFIDLLYEGYRYWDLKRWGTGHEMHQKVMRPLWPILNIDETTETPSFYYTLEVGEEPVHLETRIKWFEERDNYCPLPLGQAPGIIQNENW